MADETANSQPVKDVHAGALDPAGDAIIKVYSYNPPFYAIYRTRDRLIVQLADDPLVRARQRSAVSSLAPMRGQINGLIDGWRHAGLGSDGKPLDESASGESEKPWVFAPSRSDQYKRACRYDRRVADALITVLDEAGAPISPTESALTLETAQTLLAQVKNDIIAERTSIARAQYVRWALFMMAGVLIVTGLLSSGVLNWLHNFGRPVMPAWTAVSGGAIGAFFSIAIGLKSRDVVIDLQNRENQLDVVLRMSIGAISGAVLYCLLASGLVTTSLVDSKRIVLPAHGVGQYSDIVVFLIGFVAGFFERLVPDMLNKTNFGTPEPAGQDTPVRKPLPVDPGAAGGVAAGAVDVPDDIKPAAAVTGDAPRGAEDAAAASAAAPEEQPVPAGAPEAEPESPAEEPAPDVVEEAPAPGASLS